MKCFVHSAVAPLKFVDLAMHMWQSFSTFHFHFAISCPILHNYYPRLALIQETFKWKEHRVNLAFTFKVALVNVKRTEELMKNK